MEGKKSQENVNIEENPDEQVMEGGDHLEPLVEILEEQQLVPWPFVFGNSGDSVRQTFESNSTSLRRVKSETSLTNMKRVYEKTFSDDIESQPLAKKLRRAYSTPASKDVIPSPKKGKQLPKKKTGTTDFTAKSPYPGILDKKPPPPPPGGSGAAAVLSQEYEFCDTEKL